MATFSVAAFTPASPTAATLLTGTLVAATATAQIIVGFKTTVAISLQGATDAQAAAGVHIHFGSALKNAAATASDFFLPPSPGLYYFDLGSEFDRFSLISAGTPTYFVYVMSNK